MSKPEIAVIGLLGTASNTQALFPERLGSHLFFAFFVAQIFSPYIYGVTLYLEVLLALINPLFLFWLWKKRYNSIFYWVFVGVVGMVLLSGIGAAVKVMTTLISVLFLFYSYERNIFYLKPYLAISILVAVAQFSFLLIDPSLAQIIGPSNIAHTIWGAYATPAFSNFYAIFLFERVSGLSREAGFFASLIVSAAFLSYLEAARNGLMVSGCYKFLLFAGWVLSFSKMSFIVFPAIALEKLRRLVNLVPRLLAVIIFVLFFMVFWGANSDYLLDPGNDTFLHRFGGYLAIFDVDLKQLLFGVSSLSKIDSRYAQLAAFNYDNFAGFSGFMVQHGILLVIVFVIALVFIGVSTTGLLVLLLLTINVQLDTNQNFVVLAYFIVLKFYSGYKVVHFL